jgi:hypothetical protein
MLKVAAALAIALAASSTQAQAATLNLSLQAGASNLGGAATDNAREQAALLAASLTVDLNTYVELGAFFDHNFLEYQDTSRGSLMFAGALLRVGLLGHGSHLYADTQIGLSRRTGGPFTSDRGLGVGVAIGYRLWVLPYLDLSPRLGVRILPEPYQGSSASSNTLDFGLLLTFGF